MGFAKRSKRALSCCLKLVAKGGIALSIDFASLREAKSMVAKQRNQPCSDFASLREAKSMVAKGGIEPPTQGFSVLCSTN